MMRSHIVEVEEGKEGLDGKPSMGPVYRNILAKDGFPPRPAGIDTCWDVFSSAVENYPHNKMLGRREIVNGKAGMYVWLTYSQVYDQVLCISSAMRKCGVHPGAKCGVYGQNCPEWTIAMEACNGNSIICVPLYDTLGANAVEFIIQHAEISIVFVAQAKVSELLTSLGRCVDHVKTIVNFSQFSEQEANEIKDFGLNAFSWREFLELGRMNPIDLVPPRSFDICTIMYTSGTTGEPKGVMLTHDSISLHIGGVDHFLQQFEEKMTTDDSYFSFLPLAHIFDRVIEEYFMYKGASIGYWRGDPKLLAEDLELLQPSLFVGVPKVFDRVYTGAKRMMENAGWIRRMLFEVMYQYKLFWMRLGYEQDKASLIADKIIFRKVKQKLGGRVRLIITGAAPLASHVEEFLRVATCAMVVQGYGLTESCAGSFCALPNDLSMISTVGPPAPTIEVRLESIPEMGYDALADVPRGEICLRSDILFCGYYKREDLTKDVMVDGWFHTGDVGEWQPNGTMKIIDRKKNIFKLAQGEYVAVEHLENVYGQCLLFDSMWIYGNSFESVLVAIVVPNEQAVLAWSKSIDIDGTFVELCKDKRLKVFILNELTSVAKKNKLKGFEFIKAIHVEPVPFDVERDLVTPTFKKKRPQLLNYYQDVIRTLYANLK